MKKTSLRAGRPMEARLAVPGLRIRRVRAGLSAAELCHEIRRCAAVHPSTLIAWEVDRSRPGADVVACLARALKCKAGDLYGSGEGR